MLLIFFFKQKTAYEMRISDWSSDVCSSDLLIGIIRGDLLDNGSKLLAGAAPFRPKINDHQLRHRWFDNILPKCLYRRLFRLIQSQRRQLTSPANCSELHIMWGCVLAAQP